MAKSGEKILKSGFFRTISISDFISSLKIKNDYSIYLIDENETTTESIELDLTEALDKNKLIKASDRSELEFKNYIVFDIVPKIIPPDPSLEYSFDIKLKGNISISEKDRLAAYINKVNIDISAAKNKYFAPLINVCQSSGSGKSKLAAELMFEFPSAYIVVREEKEKKTCISFPASSKLSQNFLLTWVKDDIQSDGGSDSVAIESIVGLYLLLLRALFKDYLAEFKNYRSKKEALDDLGKKFISGKFVSRSADDVISSNECNEETMRMVEESCNTLLEEIYKTTGSSVPFLLIFDEASQISERFSPIQKISYFRLFRRALSRISKNSNFVAITLGTNSSVIDLNLELTSDSFRGSSENRLFQPFILGKNWDLFLDYTEFVKNPIDYDILTSGRMVIFLFSLGRPLWASVDLNGLEELATVKLKNNSEKTGEAYLAAWMVRTGLLVHPSHVISRYLVKSLMATVLYVSEDCREMRVYYPSEPALAFAARNLVSSDMKSHYEALEKFINQRAIDSGRFSEIIAADISLLAIANNGATAIKCDFVRTDRLPKVCGSKSFMFENEEPRHAEFEGLKYKSAEFDYKCLESAYRIITVESFLGSFYGLDQFNAIRKYIPPTLLDGIVNCTHFVQIQRDFPIRRVYNQPEFQYKTAIDRNRDIESNPCNIITRELLETGLMRQSGFMMPPNYYGLDFIIPVCLKDKCNGKPVYTCIGVQVKRAASSQNPRDVVAKGMLSSHFVKCPLNGSNCKEIGCKACVDDDYYKLVLENQLMLVASMTGGIQNLQKTINLSPKTEYECESSEIVKKAALSNTSSNAPPIAAINDYAQYTEKFLELIKECFPKDVLNDDNLSLDHFSAASFSTVDIDPLLFSRCTINSNLKVLRLVTKNKESLVAIQSLGLHVFPESLVSREVKEVAHKILGNDSSIFNEVRHPKDLPKLADAVVFRNNDGRIPIADNFMRHRYNLNQLPDIFRENNPIKEQQ